MAKTENPKSKSKYWTVVMYQENMVSDWRDTIGDRLQLPYAYCEHDLDHDSKSEHRKDHVHIIIAFPNTTTYNHVMRVFASLNAEGEKAFNKVEIVHNMRHMYEYLIHNTETCRKQKKELYPASARITGNLFDIGAFEQLSQADKQAMVRELCDSIYAEHITNFADFYMFATTNFSDEYFELLMTYSGLFERLTKGMYLKLSE